MSKIFDKIIDEQNIYKAYRKALKGNNKYTLEAIEFSMNETYSLKELKQNLIDETYQFDGYTRFVEENLNLKTNRDKSKIFPIDQGVNAVGFKIYTTHRLLRNDSKKKIKRKSKKMKRLIECNKMTVEKSEQILNSWLGHARHGNSYNFTQRLIKRNKYIYLNEKGVLKIDVSKLKEGDETDILQR